MDILKNGLYTFYCFELKGNLTNSTVQNTAETGDINCVSWILVAIFFFKTGQQIIQFSDPVQTDIFSTILNPEQFGFSSLHLCLFSNIRLFYAHWSIFRL